MAQFSEYFRKTYFIPKFRHLFVHFTMSSLEQITVFLREIKTRTDLHLEKNKIKTEELIQDD